MSKKTLYLIHHSHTDIGYTDRQEKISRYHVSFIRNAIKFLDKIKAGEAPEWEGYNYVCENYWQVEQFLAHATDEEKASFEKYVESGDIDISLTYLNLTEMVDNTMLNKKFQAARDYVSQFNRPFTSAMTADINGFSWGYADAMFDHGITNFFSCLHTHHGMFPLFKKQMPFYWETQKGDKVLVWNGDHYQIGNDFLFSPNTDQAKSFGVDGFTDKDWEEQFSLTEERVFGFFDVLDEEGYEFDFCPVMISGIVTDNSPTSPRMMEGIHRWNNIHGDKVNVELVTLNQFFEIIRGKDLDIPTYKGDWADWWADGVSSTPAGVKLYREALRKYRLVNKLDPQTTLASKERLQQAEDNLMMYAEHTWGFHSSVSEPWDAFVNILDSRKFAYAINGNRFVSDQLDDLLELLGEEPNQLDRESYFKVVNPHDDSIKAMTSIYIQHWQTVDDSYFHVTHDNFVDVIDCKTGEVIESQVSNSSRGKRISFMADLEAKEEKIVRLKRIDPPKKMDTKYYNHAHIGTDRVEDVAPFEGFTHDVSVYRIKTDYLDVKLNSQEGIESIIDVATGAELVHPDSVYAPFTGVYEVTPVNGDHPSNVRRLMGRNRKAPSTLRHESNLKDMKVLKDGPLYAEVMLRYELEGTGMYDVILTVSKVSPQIDVTIRLQKTIEWAPENLYVSLPFTYGSPTETECFFDKSGAIIRPGIDQLPGTNTEFYSLDNGAMMKNKENHVFIATKDTPLVTLGTLEAGLVELCHEESAKLNKEVLYSWAMNNFWETNFKVDLSGFYELDYSIYVIREDTNNVAVPVKKAVELIEGVLTFPYNPTDAEKSEMKG